MIGLSWPRALAITAVVAALDPIAGLVGAPRDVAVRCPQLATCIACLFAATQLQAGDPPRRAWWLFGVAHAAILVGVASQMLGAAAGVRWGLVAIANVLGPLGMLHFARTLHASGLSPALDLRTRLVVGVLAIGGMINAIVSAWSITASDTLEVVGRCASVLGDGAGFAFALLVVARVWAMAGGAAARPYAIIGAGSALFLGLDIALQAANVVTYADLGPLARLLPALGFALATTGALAQVALVRSVQRRASRAHSA